jgi:hypothetical protein
MKWSCNLLLTGVLLALATSALAGVTPTPTASPIATPTASPIATPTGTPGCDLTVEINALRGGSPTVTVDESKSITVKGRIVRGTAPKDTTLHTTLQIVAIDETGTISGRTGCPVLLEVGKGGQGTKQDIPIPQCVGGSVLFRATFFANTNDECGNPACPVAVREITKTCK